MGETFDLAMHLGPGVAKLKEKKGVNSTDSDAIIDGDSETGQLTAKPKPSKKKDEDDPRDEIKCSCGLCFGIGGSITIGAAMVIILILYLACMLEGQDKPGGCYFKEPTTGFPRYLLNATHTVKTSSHLIQSLSTPIPPAEQ